MMTESTFCKPDDRYTKEHDDELATMTEDLTFTALAVLPGLHPDQAL